ncbi:MAG: hypothetical protein ACI8V4_002854 [Ilumatobacter sp.]|jgi:hypothetical protein
MPPNAGDSGFGRDGCSIEERQVISRYDANSHRIFDSSPDSARTKTIRLWSTVRSTVAQFAVSTVQWSSSPKSISVPGTTATDSPPRRRRRWRPGSWISVPLVD